MKELKREIIGAVQDSIDLTDNQVSIPTLNIMLDEILPEQLRLYFVSQQRGLLLQAYKDGFQAAVDSLVGANEAVKNNTLGIIEANEQV